MTKKQRALAIIDRLKAEYPQAVCSLDYDEPWKLLIAVRLSAQCKDSRVNMITPELFKKYPTMQAVANSDIDELTDIVRPCGLGASKARDIRACMSDLIERYAGRIPNTMEELLSLPGIGRKSANLILGDIYHKPAVVTDTHCIRISGRMGLTDGTKNPASVEKQLLKILSPEESNDFCHRLVLHGREVCASRKPKCDECCCADVCAKNINKTTGGKHK
ncbi:MAG: endonuclease III [Eubacterium sp.]|nr:endonuclease III [Eubacterium sp.]